MKTIIIEAILTALRPITHNGGEKNGITTQFRRMELIGKNGKIIPVPVISGNGTRGKMRDLAACEVLTKSDETKIVVDESTHNLLFSGGSLESTNSEGLNIEKVRKMRSDMPTISLLGCSIGNIILPGKVDIDFMIPITKETVCLLPKDLKIDEELPSVYEITEEIMYTRKDDKKNEIYREFLSDEAKQNAGRKEVKNAEDLDKKTSATQMMYYHECVKAGAKFYWRFELRDTTEVETGAFLSVLKTWSEGMSQVGGNGAKGHGALKIDLQEPKIVDSAIEFKNNDFVNYIEGYKASKSDLSAYFEKGISKTLF